MAKATYESLHQHDDPESDSFTSTRRKSWSSRQSVVLQWLLYAGLFITYCAGVFYLGHKWRECSPCFSEKMLSAPIIWEDRTFLSSIHSDVFDPYSRESNPEGVDDAWDSIQEARIARISSAEKQELPGGRATGRLFGAEGGYAVLLDVFHQLHCLNSIRLSYYQNHTQAHEGAAKGFETPGGHIDHCFSYLAQTLMCHGDVGVMTTTWREKAQVFTADFNVTKQCRNFEAIQKWAKGRAAKNLPKKGAPEGASVIPLIGIGTGNQRPIGAAAGALLDEAMLGALNTGLHGGGQGTDGKAEEDDELVADLAAYNTTVTFSNDLNIVQPSKFADNFWLTYVPYSAVVAVDVKLVEKFDMPESAVSPTNPNEMLYQIDGFHELHCLLRLRRILVGTATKEDHVHTLHCLNYIRQTLMCNLDLTLGSTENLKNYGLKDKRICRDYKAIEAWVERNKWKDFDGWQGAKMEAYYQKLEANNETLPAEEEHKSGY
ncbi:hypothetical protein B0T14DRAFT_569346 [Immersiella caudata]|uniref:Cyclochlorotine biosynthesis protein O n=1 Tax=Immersiella caudata TaxID=314043 RepID=A0AA39WDA6_9PEZI|nr:hypothetical protein B0T14DRAFT_569346 [Immersiella caudata]